MMDFSIPIRAFGVDYTRGFVTGVVLTSMLSSVVIIAILAVG